MYKTYSSNFTRMTGGGYRNSNEMNYYEVPKKTKKHSTTKTDKHRGSGGGKYKAYIYTGDAAYVED